MTAQSASKVSQGITTPAGGYCLVPLAWLYGVWWSYRHGRLEFQDVRVYLALHEMAARRCQMTASRSPRYTEEELQSLTAIKTSRSCRESLGRLQRSGWVVWKSNEIQFTDGTCRLAEERENSWEADLGRVANRRRRLPTPRRTLRFLCRTNQPVMTATVLGHLFRCVYARGTTVSAEGSVAASWVANIFEVNIRNVKRTRAKLRNLQWLSVRVCDHWHRQRYGERVAVNLAWSPRIAIPAIKTPPPSPAKCTGLPPPDSNKELPNGIKNQKPVPPGLPGVQKTNSLKPVLRNIQPEDLRDAGRLLLLFGQAQNRGLVGKSEHDRLAFVGAAVHASTKATRNPGGFFWSLVRDRRWHHVSAADERQAQAMLKQHLFDGPPAKPRGFAQKREQDLFADVRFVSHVMQSLKAHGYCGDPYKAVAQHAPQWTRDRWNDALRRWLTPRSSDGDFPSDS